MQTRQKGQRKFASFEVVNRNRSEACVLVPHTTQLRNLAVLCWLQVQMNLDCAAEDLEEIFAGESGEVVAITVASPDKGRPPGFFGTEEQR